MKTINNIKLLSVLFILGLITSSCVQDDDFDIPEINFEEPDVDVNTTIGSVKDFYQGFEPVLIYSGDDPANSNPMYFEGYVVSNDEAGNFYKTLVVQDKPENPTAGISISTEATDMYTFYEPGRKIYFRVDGLYSGVYAGLPTLGTLDGEEVGRMSIDEFNSRILRSVTAEEIVPTVKAINAVSDSDLNTLIAFENVQVSDADLGQPYANLNNTFSVNRTIINCERTQSIIMRNSGFANFKNQIMPEGSGTLTAVFSVFNNDYQVFIRDTNDVNFDQDRCEEEDEEPQGSLLFEDFEDIANTGPGELIALDGWTNQNISGGDRRYEARAFDGNQYAQITAFNSEESTVEAWLVTPGVDLSGTAAPAFSFLTKDGYNNGEALKVYVSTDFSGDATSATWTELSATIASGTSNGYAENFTESGVIDLSDYIGETVYIGFEYVGGDGGITTTYQIDNVSLFDE